MKVNVPKHLEARLATIKVLMVDDDHYMRKVVRTTLTALTATAGSAVLVKPRKMVKLDGYYGPTPRKLVVLTDEPDDDALLLR